MRKRIISMLLAIVMVMGLMPVTASAAEVTSGTTGDCTWSFDASAGTLTISGEGAIANGQPWQDYMSRIKRIVIEEGVTSIGTNAFRNCTSLTSVSIPGSVTSIGNYAFSGCSRLTTIEYWGTAEPTAGSGVFSGCSLITVNVPTTYETNEFCGISVRKILAPPTAPEEPTTYAVTFMNDSNVFAETSVEEGHTLGIGGMPIPAKPDGATGFGGWYTEDGTFVYHGMTVSSDLTAYATWITVKTDGNGTVTYARNPEQLSQMILTVTPANGFKLKTLTVVTANNTSVTISDNTFTAPGKDYTITATFESEETASTFLIDWIVKGHNADGTDAGYRQTHVKYGDPIVAPEMTWVKDGYIFSGWKNVPVIMPADKLEIYGEWVKNFGTINWTVDGETYDTTTVTYGEKITAPATDPEKVGHTFNGWVDVPYTMPANETLTIAADFTANKYQINWYANGGYFFNQTYLTSTVSDQTYGDVIQSPPYNAYAKCTGYTLTGWNTKADGSGETLTAETIMNEASHTAVIYYAQWKANQYTITFDTDGGSEITPITQDYASAVTAPAAPAKTGYTFAGWDKDIPTAMPLNGLTVKALWTINQYTITFDTDGGSKIAPITQDYGTAVTTPADPTKPGYNFVGWDMEIPETMPAEDLTIKAQWKRKPDPTYRPTVEEIEDGDVTVSPRNPEKGDKVTITVKPDKGYVVDEVTVTDKKGDEIRVRDNGDGTYTFTQPAGKVKIEVIFAEIPEIELPFTDISEDDDIYEAVAFLYGNGLMVGVGDGTTFAPGMGLSRAMLAQILHVYEGEPAALASNFTDVARGFWYTDAIDWATHAGIIAGYGNGMFGPNDTLTREQLAVMLYQYALSRGWDVELGAALTQPDAHTVNYWAVDAVTWAVNNGLLTGNGVGCLAAGDPATRADVAEAFMALVQLYA